MDQPARLRFESYEMDLRTRELRKDGRLVKLQDQPSKLLALLASRPGELVTREEIERALWQPDEFVEYEHSINTAMRKIREALGDELEKPHFVETLPRKGYRFIAAVEALGPDGEARAVSRGPVAAPANAIRADVAVGSEHNSPAGAAGVAEGELRTLALPGAVKGSRIAEDQEYFLPRVWARGLFLAIQAGYLAIYCAALYHMEAMGQVLDAVLMVPVGMVVPAVAVLAMCGIAVRLYLLTSFGLDHPAAGSKFLKLFPLLFVLDTFWAASPLLLAREIGTGLALASVAALAYLPFAQRTLTLSIYRDSNTQEIKWIA
jgi:DNA-binding winged helix-turn-helix (wHTH) protein